MKRACGTHACASTPFSCRACSVVKRRSARQASAAALALFEHGQREAAQRGLLLVDTKYEFGVAADGRILLVDEIHTPDSSRCAFW